MHKLAYLTKFLCFFACTSIMQVSKTEAHDSNGCPIKVDVSNIAKTRDILIFGEIHGTKEMPEYFGSVICSLVTDKNFVRKITVLLEHPKSSNDELQEYLKSDYLSSDNQKLINSSPWNKRLQDGRASVAVLRLVKELGVYKKNYPQLNIQAWVDYNAAEKQRNLDSILARDLTNLYDKDHNSLVILLIGNYHGNSNYSNNMVSFLDRPYKYYKLVSMRGDSWNCTKSSVTSPLECGINPVRENITVGSDITRELPKNVCSPNQGEINVGILTASKPARINFEK